jgi:hypothetical protein
VIKLQVDSYTPTSKVSALHGKLMEFLYEHSRDYIPKMDIMFLELENMNRMTLGFWLEHRKNWQDFGAKVNRKSKVRLPLLLQMTRD